MAKNNNETRAKNAVKKAVKRNPKAFIIAVVVVVLIIAITLAVIYFTSPDTWDAIVSLVASDNSEVNQSNSGSNTKSQGDGNTQKQSDTVLCDGELLIYFIDVAQGDSAIIIFPDGKTMIIDGGDTGYAKAVTGAMDKLNITTFDYVLLTHTDADHCGSLDDAIAHAEYVENIYLPKIKSNDYDFGLSSEYKQVTSVVYNNFATEASDAVYLDDNGNEKSANLIFTEDIITITAEDNTYKMTMYCRSDEYYKNMRISNSHDINDVSPICVLEYNGRIILFTGDVNGEYSADGEKISSSNEKCWLDTMRKLGYVDDSDGSGVVDNFDADILKVPHHGGKDSSSLSLLDFIDVEYAIVSVGGKDSYETLNEKQATYNIYINEQFASDADYTITSNSKYGHPTGDVCAEGGRLQQSGVDYVYYTWLNGNITCKIDGSGNITFDCDLVATYSQGEVTYQA